MSSKDFIVHHDGALGDVILSLPVIHGIYVDNKPCHIRFIGRPHAISLLRLTDLPHIAVSSDLSLFANLYTENGYNIPAVKEYFKAFKGGVIFSRHPSSPLVLNIARLIPHIRVIRTIPPPQERKPVTDYQLNQIAININQNNQFVIDLEQASSYGFIPENIDREIVGIHPGSGGRKKCWPTSYFVQLMRLITNWLSCQFIVFAGPAEEGLINDFKALYSHQNLQDDIVFVENQQIDVVASLLSRCSLYIGNDSGITHLAALTAKRVIVLFGPTNPEVWAPMGEHVKVIQSNYSCAPCNEENYKNCKNQKCLSELSVSKVWEETESFLSNTNCLLKGPV